MTLIQINKAERPSPPTRGVERTEPGNFYLLAQDYRTGIGVEVVKAGALLLTLLPQGTAVVVDGPQVVRMVLMEAGHQKCRVLEIPWGTLVVPAQVSIEVRERP